MDYFDRFVRFLTYWTAQLGEIFLAASMIIIVLNILSRLIWKPVPGTVEIVEICGAIMLAMGIAYCAFLKGHIQVDVLVDRFSPRVQAIFDFLTNSIAFVFTFYLARETFVFATRMMNRGYVTAHLLLPIYPSIFLVAFGFFMLTLVLLRNLISSLFVIALKR